MLAKILAQKLNRDILWTLGSFSVLAASGIIINLVIAGFRDASALGVFNQSYAIYIIASQIAILGVHYSVLRHSAYYSDNAGERGRILMTSMMIALVLGLLVAITIYLFSGAIGRLLDSETTGTSVGYAAIGLVIFPLNKVLIAYLNGLRHMRAFSMLQALRYIVVMLWITFIAVSDYRFELAALGFLVAELITFIAAALYLALIGELSRLQFDFSWARRHLEFGVKSLLAGMFVEMNSRIDVLLIGFFLSDAMVGIYSFAAMLVDGLYHVLAMVRINFNPVLVTCVKDGNWEQAKTLLRKSKLIGYPFFVISAILVIVAFWVLTVYIVPEKGLDAGIFSLMILLGGLTLIAAYIPFDNLLMVSGFPGYQTLQHLAVVVVNVVLNLYLVPILGLEGAALATAASYLTGIAMLFVLARKWLGWNLWNNTVTV